MPLRSPSSRRRPSRERLALLVGLFIVAVACRVSAQRAATVVPISPDPILADLAGPPAPDGSAQPSPSPYDQPSLEGRDDAAEDDTPGDGPAPAETGPHTDLLRPPLTPVTRDPFWPVGYRPKPVLTDAQEMDTPLLDEPQDTRPPAWEDASKRLAVTGIMRDTQGGFVGIVNGALVVEGDEVAVTIEGRMYRFLVRTINEQGISFTRASVNGRAER